MEEGGRGGGPLASEPRYNYIKMKDEDDEDEDDEMFAFPIAIVKINLGGHFIHSFIN